MTLCLDEVLKTTCPRDCYDACGIHVVKRGVILRVMSASHPHNRGTLCGKCTLACNGAWRDPDARLLHPWKRIGPKLDPSRANVNVLNTGRKSDTGDSAVHSVEAEICRVP